MKRKFGYYWLKMKGRKDMVLGMYTPCTDIPEEDIYPWIIMGSDEICEEDDISKVIKYIGDLK